MQKVHVGSFVLIYEVMRRFQDCEASEVQTP